MDKEDTSIVFTGDIGFDRYMDRGWIRENLISDDILTYCRRADHVVANVEGALTEAGDDGSRGVFFHAMNPAAAAVLDRIHADIWNIGNNHIMDAGAAGLESTIGIAAAHGCRTIGAGRNREAASQPVYLSGAGGIGLFGVAYMSECIPATDTSPGVFRWDDLEGIAGRIREIKAKCRWCVIVSHGGEEFAAMPNPYTRERYLRYLQLGADAVVAHHPHVPENYETVPGIELTSGQAEDKWIFYSLGNFIFDTDYQRAHPHTEEGVLLKLSFTTDTIRMNAMGTRIVRGKEQVQKDRLPVIFRNISAAEYSLLSPLSAAAFLSEEKKKMIYLDPARFRNADRKTWDAYYYSTEPDGYDKGAHMDLSVIAPLARQAKEGTWKKSRLGEIREYLLAMTDPEFVS